MTQDDLQQLCRLVEEKDEGPAWIQMMDRSLPTMRYRAWRRDSEVTLTFALLRVELFNFEIWFDRIN